MKKPCGILVFGANGSGKTTLARELARLLQYKHMDVEAYHFNPLVIPYTNPRTREECGRLMLADIRKYGSFVISSVTGDFGEEMIAMYELAVYITAPKNIRMKRIEQRGYDQYGDRVRPGGDMFEQQLGFREWAASRPLSKIDAWAETLQCPVIHLDGTIDWRVNAKNIAQVIKRAE